VADLDGDYTPGVRSHLDLATVDQYSSVIAIRRGDGTGTFGPMDQDGTIHEPVDLIASDVDGDGDGLNAGGRACMLPREPFVNCATGARRPRPERGS